MTTREITNNAFHKKIKFCSCLNNLFRNIANDSSTFCKIGRISQQELAFMHRSGEEGQGGGRKQLCYKMNQQISAQATIRFNDSLHRAAVF